LSLPIEEFFMVSSCRTVGIALLVVLPLGSLHSAWGADQKEAAKVDAKVLQQTIERGIQFLLNNGQAEDGSFSKQAGVGVTALATMALLRNGRSPDDPAVAKSLKYLEQSVRGDGSIAADRSRIPNYETCLAISALSAANKDGRYTKILKPAEGFIKEVQIDAGEGKDKSDFSYGGSGYGKGSRPDLSNTAFVIDALHDLGREGDDEAIQKALVFVSRCQNLESQYNTAPFAAKNPDGGFYYTVDEGGGSAAGTSPDGGLRSYGTMTYAGLKSMIFAGVAKDDLRVKAAKKWLEKNYSVKENLPMGKSGLFYYYHTMAKCLDALGQDTFDDEKGAAHNWRKELVDELAERQKPNGSWVNDNQRWLEGDPNLVTAYALLVLSYCKEPAK
jgi:squalene-hopene/tetraprenyl-beta-curcumene cyclase